MDADGHGLKRDIDFSFSYLCPSAFIWLSVLEISSPISAPIVVENSRGRQPVGLAVADYQPITRDPPANAGQAIALW